MCSKIRHSVYILRMCWRYH